MNTPNKVNIDFDAMGFSLFLALLLVASLVISHTFIALFCAVVSVRFFYEFNSPKDFTHEFYKHTDLLLSALFLILTLAFLIF